MYAIGKNSNKADLVQIAGSEDKVIISNFTDDAWMDIGTVGKLCDVCLYVYVFVCHFSLCLYVRISADLLAM